MRPQIPSPAEIDSLLAEHARAPLPAMRRRWLAALIDHTLLKPGATDDQHRQLCAEAIEHGFATVCVYPERVAFCASILRGSNVRPIAVVGFPTGEDSTDHKTEQTRFALGEGAAEIDMVIRVSDLRARRLRHVYRDIRAVVKAAGDAPVKVILETCLLNDEEKTIGAALSLAAGAAFVKTSTGFSTGGATEADVALLRRTVGQEAGVKASGGIRSLEDALRMVRAGASRLGTSGGVALVSGNSSQPSQTGVY